MLDYVHYCDFVRLYSSENKRQIIGSLNRDLFPGFFLRFNGRLMGPGFRVVGLNAKPQTVYSQEPTFS